MRILHTNFHRGWGGQPSRILMLSRQIASRGHEVITAAPRGSLLAERSRSAGLTTYEELEFRKSNRVHSAVRDVLRLAGHLKTTHYDLIDAHGSQDVWTCAAARAVSRSTVPLVFTRHNTKRVRHHTANRWLYRHGVDHLIVVSRSVLDRYGPFLACGDLVPDRISIIHSAYRTERFHPGLDRSRLRAELGVTAETPLIGAIGRLVPDKGQDDLLRAAVHVLAERPEALFLLAGTGTSEKALRDLAASLGIAGSVRFLGFRDDVPIITAGLTLSILPSIDCDASSAVLKEALACGVPAIATDIGGAAEILRDGETGLVVPPRAPETLSRSILTLLNNPDRARDMGERGCRDVSRRFTPDRLADETLEAYRTVIERHARRDP